MGQASMDARNPSFFGGNAQPGPPVLATLGRDGAGQCSPRPARRDGGALARAALRFAAMRMAAAGPGPSLTRCPDRSGLRAGRLARAAPGRRKDRIV